jgi:hypothetical protein
MFDNHFAQELWLDFAGKRWDALAFHIMAENDVTLKQMLVKNIPGGIGGPAQLSGQSLRVVREEKKAKLESDKSESMSMQRELHKLQVLEFAQKQDVRNANAATGIMQQIRELLKLKADFVKYKDQDMVDDCNKDILELKASLALSRQQPVTPSQTPLPPSQTPTLPRADRFSPTPTPVSLTYPDA